MKLLAFVWDKIFPTRIQTKGKIGSGGPRKSLLDLFKLKFHSNLCNKLIINPKFNQSLGSLGEEPKKLVPKKVPNGTETYIIGFDYRIWIGSLQHLLPLHSILHLTVQMVSLIWRSASAVYWRHKQTRSQKNWNNPQAKHFLKKVFPMKFWCKVFWRKFSSTTSFPKMSQHLYTGETLARY